MGESPQSGGIATLNHPAKFGFFPAGKEFVVVGASCRGAWEGARVAGVGYGRASTRPYNGL